MMMLHGMAWHGMALRSKVLVCTGHAQPILIDRDGLTILTCLKGDPYFNDLSKTHGWCEKDDAQRSIMNVLEDTGGMLLLPITRDGRRIQPTPQRPLETVGPRKKKILC